MDRNTKSKLIMDKEDLVGEHIEDTDRSFRRVDKESPEFFRKRKTEMTEKVNEDSTVTVVEDSEEALRFNTAGKHKNSSAS